MSSATDTTAHAYEVRAWDPRIDLPLISEWREGHGAPVLPWELIPKLGATAFVDRRPTVIAHASMDNSIPVATLAWLHTRPGVPLGVIRRAVQECLGGLEAALVTLGYRCLFAHLPESLLREANKLGFEAVGGPSIMAGKSLIGEEGSSRCHT